MSLRAATMYHGPEGSWTASRRVEDLFELPRRWRALLPHFEYLLDDLTAEPGEARGTREFRKTSRSILAGAPRDGKHRHRQGLVRKNFPPRLFSMKGAATMATVTMQSPMNPKHTDTLAGCIESLSYARQVSAPLFFAGLALDWKPPGF